MWIVQDGKSPVRSDAYFPEWKPAFRAVYKKRDSSVIRADSCHENHSFSTREDVS